MTECLFLRHSVISPWQPECLTEEGSRPPKYDQVPDKGLSWRKKMTEHEGLATEAAEHPSPTKPLHGCWNTQPRPDDRTVGNQVYKVYGASNLIQVLDEDLVVNQ